jgi:hypothetical protein
MCIRHRCIATSAALTTEKTALLLLREFASVGMCLPNRCLAVDHSGFHASCHNMKCCSLVNDEEKYCQISDGALDLYHMRQ